MPASRRRLLPALAASVTLHMLLLGSTPPVKPSAVQGDGLADVRTRLQWTVPATAEQPDEDLRLIPVVTARRDARPVPVTGGAVTDPRRVPLDTAQSGSGNGDSAIYDVHELDRFPRPLTALRLMVPDAVPGGRLRARVVISRVGQVLQVDLLEAPEALAESAKRLLSQARFSPAMREGRVVDSRTLIELAYGPLSEG